MPTPPQTRGDIIPDPPVEMTLTRRTASGDVQRRTYLLTELYMEESCDFTEFEDPYTGKVGRLPGKDRKLTLRARIVSAAYPNLFGDSDE